MEARRGPLGQSLEPAPQLVASIPPKKLSEIARGVALKLGLPWRVQELLESAFEARRTIEDRVASSGLSGEDASEEMLRRIREQVTKASKTWQALPPYQGKPTPEQVETALEAFNIEECTALLGSVGQREIEALLSYIRQNEGELKQRLGAREAERIEARAIMRARHEPLAQRESLEAGAHL
jgi:hypothetical protein